MVAFGTSVIYKGGVGGGAPDPPSYTWDLGDLADQSARLTDAVLWDDGSWADPYDTEAELTALGWQVIDIPELPTSGGITCANGGSGDSSDEAAFTAFLSAQCPNGGTYRDCANDGGSLDALGDRTGVIFKIPASCHIDMTASDGNQDSTPTAVLNYQNFALIGAGMDSSYINCNNVADIDTVGAPCLGNDPDGFPLTYSAHTGTETGTEYTWSSGTTVGTTSVTLTGGDCSTFADGDRLIFKGTDEDARDIRFINEVSSRSGCSITLTDPIRRTVTTPLTARETNVPYRNLFFMNFSVGFPYYPDGAGQDASYAGAAIQVNHTTGVLISGMRVGPSGNVAIDTVNNLHTVIKDSELGPNQFGKRRGTNQQAFISARNSHGGPVAVYNNVLVDGFKRIAMMDGFSNLGSWFGFNYMNDQEATAVGETGNHCEAVGNPQGIAHDVAPSAGPQEESVIFVGHNNGEGTVGGYLIESNDFNCRSGIQGLGGSQGRYSTLFRNRQNRYQGVWNNWNDDGSFTAGYNNWIANRFNGWPATANIWTNALGRWNVGDASAGAITATGATWPDNTPPTNFQNYVDEGPHDYYGSVDIPPSLAIKTDTAPSWWCQESGDWNGTWSFGYGDGGDNGGTPRKLPAQIRYEIREGLGGTCTPP